MALLRHYFPGTEPGKLTFEVFCGMLSRIRRIERWKSGDVLSSPEDMIEALDGDGDE